jgi:hypothetical protein
MSSVSVKKTKMNAIFGISVENGGPDIKTEKIIF